jgi:zinc transporter
MNNKVDQLDIANLPSEDGLLFACTLDGSGGGSLKDWTDLEAWKEGSGPIWAHLERTSPRVQEWLRNQSCLTPVTVEAMLAEETRPRSFKGTRAMIAILRGINTNVGAESSDMVDIRVWSDGQRVLSIRHLQLTTPREILTALIQHG